MSIIIKPIITEKITKDGEIFNRFGFIVQKTANKIQIKNAVEAAYGVNVVEVNTMNYRPNRSVKYTKSGLISGKTNAEKKAFVQVKEGESIDRALKRYKRKFDKTGTIRQLRGRKQFTKHSVTRRKEVIKAAYIQDLRNQEED